MVRLNVDLIVVSGDATDVSGEESDYYHTHRYGERCDPVGAGLVASLARPGGNVTGLASLSPELNSKRLEVLQDRFLSSPELDFCGCGEASIAKDLQLKDIQTAAQALS